MRHAEQVAQIREMIGHIDRHTVPQTDRVLSCPMTAFTDPEVARMERETLFWNHPQLIGLSGELDGPNSFFTVNDFGIPILATRDKDGLFRAFVNACRHRGAAVAQQSRGKAARHICPYHAWTYGSDGALLKVREAELFGEVDKDCNGLIELPAQEKYGLLWVHPRREGRLDIDELLGAELAAELDSWQFGRSEYRAELTLDKPLNWKLASDTFCEAYHFGVLHSRTVANVVHGDFSTYKSFGNNHRMNVPNRNIKCMLEKPEAEWSLPPVVVAAYYLFPNVHLISNGNLLSVTRIFPHPHDPGRSISRITIFQSDHLVTAPEGGQVGLSGDNIYEVEVDKPVFLEVSALLQLFDTTVEQEDYKIACQIQESANSGLLDAVRFGRNEPGVQHAHNAIRTAIGLPELAAESIV